MKISNLDILKNSRLAMGLSLFIIAILAGGLIAKEANRTVMVWATQSDLAPGDLIKPTDLKSVSVLLPESAKNYLSTNAQIVGGLILKGISSGDLIPAAAIAIAGDALENRFVPLTLEPTDLPMDLQRGEVVDIYAIPNRDSKVISQPQLVAADISISQVTERSNAGKVSVLVILNNDQVLPTLQMLSDSRLIIVRSI
jgi:hypothetical protein